MFQNNLLMGAASAGGVALVEVENSALFNSAASEYLSRTWTASDRLKWTFSTWFYRTKSGTTTSLLTGNYGTSSYSDFRINTSNLIEFFDQSGPSLNLHLISTQLIRDIAWYNIVIVYDSAQGTAADRVTIYLNGAEVTSFGTATYPSASLSSQMQTATPHTIGWDGVGYLEGYVAESVFLDGVASTSPTDFGEFDTTGLYWTPKSSTAIKALTFGAEGLYLDNVTNAQTDASGNGNNFINNNTVVTSTHTPTNSEALLNPLSQASTSGTVSIGNTKYTGAGAYFRSGLMTTLPCDSGGKWYWETRIAAIYTTNAYSIFGVSPSDLPRTLDYYPTSPGNTPFQGGQLYFSGASLTELKANASAQDDNVAGSMTVSIGSIVQVAFDAATQKLWYGINNTWYNSGNPATGANPSSTLTATDKTWYPWFAAYTVSDILNVNMGTNPTFNGAVTAQNNADGNGEGNFYYAPPTGFLTINTNNIAAETTRTQSDPYEHWNNILYTGNGTAIGSGGNAITGAGFQPDFGWIKGRSGATEHVLTDIVRGVTKELSTNDTGASETVAEGLTAFGSDGFTVGSNGSYNTSSATYVAWCAKLGGTASTNEAGATNTSISVNTTLGMSVGTYSGANATTLGHGLGVVPEMIIVKRTNGGTGSWIVYHSHTAADPSQGYLVMDTANGYTDSGASIWNDTMPTSSVFSVGNNISTGLSGNTYMFIAFAPSEYISIGSYEGNGNANGTLIPTLNSLDIPIQPVWAITKSMDSTSNWEIYDAERLGYNPENAHLDANLTTAESTADNLDIVTGGLKMRIATDPNVAETYLYMAIGTPTIDVDGRIIAGR